MRPQDAVQRSIQNERRFKQSKGRPRRSDYLTGSVQTLDCLGLVFEKFDASLLGLDRFDEAALSRGASPTGSVIATAAAGWSWRSCIEQSSRSRRRLS